MHVLINLALAVVKMLLSGDLEMFGHQLGDKITENPVLLESKDPFACRHSLGYIFHPKVCFSYPPSAMLTTAPASRVSFRGGAWKYRLTILQTSEGITESQIPNDIKRNKRIPLHHIVTLGIGDVFVDLHDELVDKLVHDRLLLRQRSRRETIAQKAAQPSVLVGIALTDDGWLCAVVIERAFGKYLAAPDMAVDVLPGAGRAIG